MQRFFKKNVGNLDAYTKTNNKEEINFLVKADWTEIDLADFESALKEGDGVEITHHFFLEDLVSMPIEERKDYLSKMEAEFELVGPSYCIGEAKGFDFNLDFDEFLCYEAYKVDCTVFFKYLPDENGEYEESLLGKLVGLYQFEQKGEIYNAPMIVANLSGNFVEVVDLLNLKKVEIKGRKKWER